MNDVYIPLIGSIITGITALSGVYLGTKLNERNRSTREKESEERQIKSVRLLINSEIEQNIKLLQEFWNELMGDLKQIKDENILINTINNLMSAPLPIWSHKMLEDQVPFLTLSFNEHEIKDIHHFHIKLDRINSIHSAFLSSLSEREREWFLHPDLQDLDYNPLLRAKIKKFWIGFEKNIKDVLKNDNPLKKDDCTFINKNLFLGILNVKW